MNEKKNFNRVITLTSSRAYLELKDRSPLSFEEWDRFRLKLEDCGLKGLPFDDVSYLYPLQIPQQTRVRILQESPRTVSVLGIYDRSICVSVIGDSELESCYIANSGAFLYVVGKLEKQKKNDREFHNLRPRGWIVVQIKANLMTDELKGKEIPEDPAEKRKKKC